MVAVKHAPNERDAGVVDEIVGYVNSPFFCRHLMTAFGRKQPSVWLLSSYVSCAENAPAVKAISAPLIRIRRAASCQ